MVAFEEDWDDFAVLMTLQMVNGVVGYFEEKSAGDAIDALKQSLAPRAFVTRDGVMPRYRLRILLCGVGEWCFECTTERFLESHTGDPFDERR